MVVVVTWSAPANFCRCSTSRLQAQHHSRRAYESAISRSAKDRPLWGSTSPQCWEWFDAHVGKQEPIASSFVFNYRQLALLELVPNAWTLPQPIIDVGEPAKAAGAHISRSPHHVLAITRRRPDSKCGHSDLKFGYSVRATRKGESA